jgi:DNA polymerase-3 subunit alpha
MDCLSNSLLKANYPAEYMAAVLSNNMSDIKQVSFFMEECKRMGLEVLGPDVNEYYKLPLTIIMRCVLGWERLKGGSRSSSDHCSK